MLLIQSDACSLADQSAGSVEYRNVSAGAAVYDRWWFWPSGISVQERQKLKANQLWTRGVLIQIVAGSPFSSGS